MRTFFDKHKHSLFLLYFLIYTPWFGYLERTVTTHFHVIHMAIDDYIPFCEYFIVPYLLWFAYVAVGVAYFYRKNREDYTKLCVMLFTGMTVFLVISTLYPNGHYLRPTDFARDNIFVDAVKWLYATDTSTNLFPSIHVFNSIAIHVAVWKSEDLKEKRMIRFGSAVMMSSIILSTMFLKQHSVFDVLTALVMASFLYTFIYGTNTGKLFVRQRGKYERKLPQI